MKNPISWHEECLRNQKRSLDMKIIALLDMQNTVNKVQKEYDFYQLQIETAKKMGKDGFDCQKFLVKRNALAKR